MQTKWLTINGIIQRGHQVASGIATDSPYPEGTIIMQTPFFKALGLDLSPFFPGTLNISISPYQFSLKQPEYTFCDLKWNRDYPAEDFSFSPCRVGFGGIMYPGLVYYPHPESKIGHFQDPSILEVLAAKIPNIGYGDVVQVEVNSEVIRLRSKNSDHT